MVYRGIRYVKSACMYPPIYTTFPLFRMITQTLRRRCRWRRRKSTKGCVNRCMLPCLLCKLLVHPDPLCLSQYTMREGQGPHGFILRPPRFYLFGSLSQSGGWGGLRTARHGTALRVTIRILARFAGHLQRRSLPSTLLQPMRPCLHRRSNNLLCIFVSAFNCRSAGTWFTGLPVLSSYCHPCQRGIRSHAFLCLSPQCRVTMIRHVVS